MGVHFYIKVVSSENIYYFCRQNHKRMKTTIGVGILYSIIVVVLGAATIYGEYEGLDRAIREIYHAWWFILLWAALALGGIVHIVRRRIKDIPTLMLHSSLVLILAGALVTQVWGIQGSIHLRKGSFAVYYDSEGSLQQLPFAIRLDSFSMQLHPENGNVADYRSKLTLADMSHNILRQCEVSMNNIMSYKGWRFYQWSYDSDGMGSTLIINRDPWGIAVTYIAYILLFMSITWIAIRGSRRTLRLRLARGRLSVFERIISGIAIVLSSITAVLGAAFLATQLCGTNPWIMDMQPVLNSPYLSVHVSVITIAYVLLLLCLVCSVRAFIGGNKSNLRLLSLALLYPSMAMLVIGIFIGAIWANVSWGNYWGWDPKEVWSLVTMMIYAVALHSGSLPWLRRPAAYHAYMAVSFLTILMTFFGVNFLLSGLHSYL